MNDSNPMPDLSGCVIGNDGEVLENNTEEPVFSTLLGLREKIEEVVVNLQWQVDEFVEDENDNPDEISYFDWCQELIGIIDNKCAELRKIEEKIDELL